MPTFMPSLLRASYCSIEAWRPAFVDVVTATCSVASTHSRFGSDWALPTENGCPAAPLSAAARLMVVVQELVGSIGTSEAGHEQGGEAAPFRPQFHCSLVVSCESAGSV